MHMVGNNNRIDCGIQMMIDGVKRALRLPR